MIPPKPIRVVVVDDSAMVRRLVTDALNADPAIEVVGTAVDPYAARDRIIELAPDVLTLDIEMPRMDGLTFLRILMKHHPMPIIIMSSLSQAGSHYALEALEAGAVDVMAKPRGACSVGEIGDELVRKVKAAAQARRRAPAPPAPPAIHGSRLTAREFHPAQVILLGASTGGTEALKDVLTQLPAAMPGICIVQHIPAYFSGAFAERLNKLCALDVREARDGDAVEPGLALVAPGDYHLLLRRRGPGYSVQLKQGPKVWHQRPAVDLLFQSAAPLVGDRAIAGVLTGMGQDGAEGLLRLKQSGSRTFAQDEKSCVVFGMPRAARDLGATDRMVSLPHIAAHLITTAEVMAANLSSRSPGI